MAKLRQFTSPNFPAGHRSPVTMGHHPAPDPWPLGWGWPIRNGWGGWDGVGPVGMVNFLWWTMVQHPQHSGATHGHQELAKCWLATLKALLILMRLATSSSDFWWQADYILLNLAEPGWCCIFKIQEYPAIPRTVQSILESQPKLSTGLWFEMQYHLKDIVEY